MADVDDQLAPELIQKIQRAVSGVKISEDGWIAPNQKRGFIDWRSTYVRHCQRQFPEAWVYRGGHHVAVHASAPAPDGQAGRVLFRIIEVKKLHPLACGLHHGEVRGGRCSKCSTGWTHRELANQRDRALVSALEPLVQTV